MKYDVKKLARDLWGMIGPKIFNMPDAAAKAYAKTYGIPLGVFLDATNLAQSLFASKQCEENKENNMSYNYLYETNNYVNNVINELTEEEATDLPQDIQDFLKKHFGRGKTPKILSMGRREANVEISGQKGLNVEALKDMMKFKKFSGLSAGKGGNLILSFELM